MADYKWRDNLACVATYKILEADKLLDQFEDSDVAFEGAGKLTMGKLRYYPKTTSNPNILEILSMEISRKFLTYVVKYYTSKKEVPSEESADIISAVAAVFLDKDATLAKLAGVVDAKIRFPDEGARA